MTGDRNKGRVVVTAQQADGQPLGPPSVFNARASIFGAEQLQAGITCASLSQTLAAQMADRLPKNMFVSAEGVVKTVCTDENGAPAGGMTCAITKPSHMQDDLNRLRKLPSASTIRCQ